MITREVVGRGVHRLRREAWMKMIEEIRMGVRGGGGGRKWVGWR